MNTEKWCKWLAQRALAHRSGYVVSAHCKNKWAVLTRVVTMVTDKLERQWLLEGMED